MSEVLALLLFRIAARALPRRVREAVGDEMRETFRAAWRDRRGGRRLAFTLYSAADLVTAGIGERWRARETSTKRRPKVNSLWQDVRYAARSLTKTPGFSFVAVLTLALGIGANVSIFSVVNAVLLRPLPFEDPDRLVEIWESRVDRGVTQASFTMANFRDLQDQNKSFTAMAGLLNGSINLTGLDFPERLSLGRVSANFFRTLGVTPAAGRSFVDAEDQAGADGLQAVLSHGLWLRRFGGEEQVVGRTITLDGRPYTVIGVLPRGQPWLDAADVFIPMVRTADPDRASWELAVIGRLRPGMSVEAALADLTGIARGIAERFPENARGMGVTIGPSSEWRASEGLRRSLWVLMGAVGFLLLIACVNLANLSLARATGRSRERALRAALGASKGRLVRQAFTESMLLSLGGAVAGLGLAFGVIEVLRSLDPGGIPRLGEVNVSLTVVGFTVAAIVVTGLLTGIVPALHAAQGELGSALREGDRRAGTGRGMGRVRAALVAVEVSASLALLVGAGLLLRSFAAVLGTERGFQTADRVLAQVALPQAYTAAQADHFLATMTARLQGQPGITSVAAVSRRPLSGVGTGMGFAASDKPDPASDRVPWAGWRVITAGYFRTMGVPLVAGRDFTPSDIISKPWRVIISERVARLLWPGENAVGRTLVMWKGQSNLPAEVIGVAADMRDWDLAGDPSYSVYFPSYGAGAGTLYFVVHGRTTPQAIRPVFRQLLAEVDRTIPLARVESLEELVGESVASRRFIMLLLAAFASVALLLALAGVYGVLSYVVSRRTGEIGVRLALGASPRAVVRLIVAQGMRPVVIGLVVGLGLAYVLTRLMTNLLFGISATDLGTYGAVALLLGGAALLSCYLPARQALGVDVVAALRKE